LRILLVSDHYPPFIGGAHRQTQLLGSELHRRGHDVSIATVWSGGQPTWEDENGVGVYRLKTLQTWLPWFVRDHRQRHQPPYPDPVSIWGLRGLIDHLQPDVVHSYGWITYSCALALTGKNVPLLMSVRDYAYSCAKQTLLYHDRPCEGPAPLKCLQCAGQHYGVPKGWIAVGGVYQSRSLVARKIRGVHSISNFVKQILQRDFWDPLLLDPGSVIQAVIPSFREDDAGKTYSAEPEVQSYLQRLPKEPFILFVGALRIVKGLNQLLAAYMRLGSPVPLVLIGTIEQDTPRNFPPGVLLLDSYPHVAVMAAWERCLFGVLPSLWPEPLGSVVYEGMSRGKAVIGTAPSGHSDMIVHGETGLLVPPGDVQALTDAMKMLIENPELREQYGRAGRVRSREFTAQAVIPRFEQLYRQLAAGSLRRPVENDFVPPG
jgi:glycosyltransferase involved in cell wall biosynthesis